MCMKFSVQQIADLIEGSVEGDGKAIVSSLSKIEEGKEGTLSFLANPSIYPIHLPYKSNCCYYQQ